MNDDLTLEKICDIILEQHKYLPCKKGYVRPCGCGMIHDHYGMCKNHHNILLSDSNLIMYCDRK